MTVWASLAAPSSDGPNIPGLLLVLAAVLAATKLLGTLARRLGQPAVLGELIAGILLGGSALHWLDPTQPVIKVLAELGALILLFEVGLETNLASLAKVGGAALTVGAAGIILPFVGGFAVAASLGVSTVTSIVIAAALTATSIGISARVLGDLGRLKTSEGQIVLGAAVFDDVIGLVVLAVVSQLVAGVPLTALGVGRTAVVAIGFVVLAILVGTFVARPAMAAVARLNSPGTVGVTALVMLFLNAALAAYAGSALIIGAFAAGVVLNGTPQRREVESWVTSLGHVLVPLFFAAVGAEVDLRAMMTPQALGLGGALIAVAVAGKVAAGYAPWWFRGHKLLIGVAMVPRGEVGLIFASLGLSAGVLDAGEFGALIAMVLVTTFVAPPWLAVIARKSSAFRDDDDDDSLDHFVASAAPPGKRETQARTKLT